VLALQLLAKQFVTQHKASNEKVIVLKFFAGICILMSTPGLLACRLQ
jgi:hypothetical protein